MTTATMTNRQVLETCFAPATLKTRDGQPKTVRMHDPVFCTLENRRVRFAGLEADGMVNVAEDSGKRLPDLRHASQVLAY